MVAGPQMYLLKEFYSFLAGDAVHKDARGATLVHLTVDEALQERVTPVG